MLSHLTNPPWYLWVGTIHRPTAYQAIALPLSYTGIELAGPAGIEPTSPSSKHGILSIELRTEKLARPAGIEPTSDALEERCLIH